MKKLLILLMLICLIIPIVGCGSTASADIAATTLPVYEFTQRLCQGTGHSVIRLVTESVSCLHDYTLQVSQMRAIESAQVIVCSGAGLEEFLEDALHGKDGIIDASVGIELLCPEEAHEHEGHDHNHDHHHDQDPHIWLSPENAKIMAQNICDGLCTQFPEDSDVFRENLIGLITDLEALQQYGDQQLGNLSCRDLITFHDGFAYFAESFDLHILEAIEEESGSEASAAELIRLIQLTSEHQLPAIFIEENGSSSAAQVISAETGASVYTLSMAMAGNSYFDAMYQNIDAVKEALK